MNKNPNGTVAQKEVPVFVTVRIPAAVDAALEHHIAGTNITKREVVEEALRQYLEMEQ